MAGKSFDGGSAIKTIRGVSDAPVTSADLTTEADVSEDPAAAVSIVLDDIIISVGDTAMNIDIKDGDAGDNILPTLYLAANQTVQITTRAKNRLGAGNAIRAQASAAGNVSVMAFYHYETAPAAA